MSESNLKGDNGLEPGMVKVIDVERKRSVPLVYLSQGHKGGSRPASTPRLKWCGGRNGSHVMYDRAGNADILVTVEMPDGSAYPISIGQEVRRAHEGVLSPKIAERVVATCPEKLKLVNCERKPVIDKQCLDAWFKSAGI